MCPGGISSNLAQPTRRARAAPPTSLRPPSRRPSCWAPGPGRTSRTRCCTPSPGCRSAAPTGWRSSSHTAPTGSSAPAPTARAACGTFVEVTHTPSRENWPDGELQPTREVDRASPWRCCRQNSLACFLFCRARTPHCAHWSNEDGRAHGARHVPPRLGLTINWLGISEVVSLNPSNWQL